MKEIFVNSELLVSIIIGTYNSSRFVLETLESAYNQSYKNVELIITDDCSTDNTVEICTDWLAKYKNRFLTTKIVTSPVNTGISPNCYRGITAANGEWVKLIAGDDILDAKCVENNCGFIHEHPDIKVLFSAIHLFKSKNNTEKQFLHVQPFEEQKKWFYCDAETQYKQLLTDNFNWTAPSIFCHKSLLAEFYKETRFPYIEDYPFWLKVTQSGVPLRYMDKMTVLYRQSESITRVANKWINEHYFESVRNHFQLEVAPQLKEINRKVYMRKKLQLYKTNVLINCFSNKKTLGAKVFNRVFNTIVGNT